MSRLAEALMGNKAFARNTTSPVIDLRYGGQMGYAPEYAEWVSNQQYVRRNLIPLLVDIPRGFLKLPESDYWIGTLRALVELQAISITGLEAGLEVEFAETPFGGGGQVQEDFVNVTERKSQVTFKWNEKYGLPVHRFLDGWIRNLMQDPHSKVANINTFAGNKEGDMLADKYAATMIFIEPDPTHTFVNKAWLVTNMVPKNSGQISGARDLTQAGETSTYDVEFTGIAQYGLGVNALAQRLLDAISITGANPYNRQAFVNQISAEVTASRKGYASGVESLAAGAVNRP
jgi:hypothetical protein